MVQGKVPLCLPIVDRFTLHALFSHQQGKLNEKVGFFPAAYVELFTGE